MPKDEQYASRRYEEEQAVQIALAWLWETYPEETDKCLRQGFFGRLTTEEFESFEELESWLDGLLNINSLEWLLAEGNLIIDGAPKPAIELLLGPGGPLLPAHGREWLKAMVESPLRLYEVQEAKPGEGLRVLDLLDPAAAMVWVREQAASNTLARWDILGARLIRQGDTFVFSGAIYPFERLEGSECRDLIVNTIASGKPNEKERRTLAGSVLIDAWLKGLLADQDVPPPEVVDAATGDKILLTTDYYRVHNWPALETTFGAQDDVDGDREKGWDRFTELDDGRYRPHASMMANDSGMLEVSCRTPQLADEARQWLENIAGDLISFAIREVTDPRSQKTDTTGQHMPELDMPQVLQRQILHQYLAKHYETWPEMSLPALEGKSPLEAVEDERLRPAVDELLKSIEQLEEQRSCKPAANHLMSPSSGSGWG